MGQWNFTSGLTASTGVDLEYYDGPGGATEAGTQFGTTASFGIANAGGQVVNVMRVPKTTSTMGYVLNPNAIGNGGGSLLNLYSLVFDVYFPAASSDRNRCLIQIDEPWGNSNDGEFYVAANNGLGTAAQPQGTVTPDDWHRLVITVDLTASPPTVRKYINGTKVGEESLADALDGRWALGTYRALLFTDNAGAFEVAYVNSIQVHDAVLSPGYIAALGSPAEDAIPTAVVPVAVVGELRPPANDAFVLPGTVIEADLLPAGQPIPAASVEMRLDGMLVSSTLSYPSGDVLRVSHHPGVLAPESQHTVRLSYVDPSVGTHVQQVEWSFRMSPYHLAPPDPTTEGLLYLGFEEPAAVDGMTVADRSPSRNDGILHLQPGVGDLKVAGAVGNAIDFSINQTSPQNIIELKYGYTKVPNTFAAWVKVDSNYPSASRVGVILGNYPADDAINWEIQTSGRPRVYWGYNSGSLVDWTTADDLRTGQWEHLVFVRDVDQGFFYYRNGRLAAVHPNPGPAVLPVDAPYVGSDLRPSRFQPFRGALDELILFERPLGSNEVFRLYTAHSTFPKFLFATPPITRLRPTDGAMSVTVTTPIEALVDESFSSNTVNLASVQLSINGSALSPKVGRSNQLVFISASPAVPLTPLTTNQVRVRFLDNASTPHETIRTWNFVTGPLSAVPEIVWFSEGVTVAVGEDVTLGVRASGMLPIEYQWRADGTPISGETNTTLTLLSVSTGQTGGYDVVVTGPSGAVTSRVAQLTVLPTLPLAGLLYDVTAHYSFEGHVDGVVSNAARVAGHPGFAQDEAYLNGTEGAPSTPPWTTDPAKVRAGVGALDCDGAGDYGVIVGNPVDVGFDWSVAAWFKPDTGGAGYLGSTRASVFETGGSAYPISFGLRAGTSGNSNFQLYSDYVSGTDPYRDYQVANETVDQWHHIAIVYRSASAVIEGYLDGVLTHQIAVTGTLNPNWSGFHVGTYRNANARWFKGQMDEVALWQRALTREEVTDLYEVGQRGQTLATRISQPGGAVFQTALMAYYDFDEQSNWVVANRGPAVGGTGAFGEDALTMQGGYIDPEARIYPITHDPLQARVGQGALIGDGTDNYAHIAGAPVNPNQNWSVAAWFKPDTGGLGITDSTRMSVFETGGFTYPISFGLRAGTPDPDTGDPQTNFQIYSHLASGAAVHQDYNLPNTQVDQWHHITITYAAAAGVIKGYLDGSETHSIALGPETILQDYTGFNIGTYRTAEGRWFKGLIDEVAFWQRKLSSREVSRLFALGEVRASLLTRAPEILAFYRDPINTDDFVLMWSTSPGLKYAVEATSNPSDWPDTPVAEYTAQAATATIIISRSQPPPANGYYDSGLNGATQRYYRVKWDF